jgi:hypothetical protein
MEGLYQFSAPASYSPTNHHSSILVSGRIIRFQSYPGPLGNLKITHRGPGGEEVKFLFTRILIIFFRGHAKICNLMTTPSVVLNNGGDKNPKKKEKLPKIVATFVYASRFYKILRLVYNLLKGGCSAK